MSTAAINKLSLWENLINERKESGLTIREWIKLNNRSRREYYYWNRKIKDLSMDGEIRFADITNQIKNTNKKGINSNSDNNPGYKLQVGNLLITIPDAFNSHSLAELLKILAKLMIRHIADGADHIYLAIGATDFRLQLTGLTSLVSLKFKLNPHSGTNVFLFCNKKRNTLRALRWDRNGFILVTKTLVENMKFQWPRTEGEIRDITKRQLEWLLEGLQIDQQKAHKSYVETSKYIY